MLDKSDDFVLYLELYPHSYLFECRPIALVRAEVSTANKQGREMEIRMERLEEGGKEKGRKNLANCKRVKD